MILFRRWAAGLFAMMSLCIASAAFAGVKDAVFNKEGVWSLDVDHGACVLSRTLDEGSTFVFRAEAGALSFGFFSNTAVQVGRAGLLELGAMGFDFEPSYEGGGTVLFYDGVANDRVLAALRSAHDLRISVDDRPVVRVKLDDTGFRNALHDALACSRGSDGWWGEGVKTAGGPPPDDSIVEPVLDKTGYWAFGVAQTPGLCVAASKVGEHMQIHIVAVNGSESLAIQDTQDLPEGPRGRIETDNGVFEFKGVRDETRRYLSMREPMDSAALAILRRAKETRVTVGGEVLLEVYVGFGEILDDVAACSRGASGWWGKGAKP